jgi:hypothetical protein
VIWSGSPHLERVSVAQKRVVRAMVGARFYWNPDEPNSCKPLFLKLDILPVFSIYIAKEVCTFCTCNCFTCFFAVAELINLDMNQFPFLQLFLKKIDNVKHFQRSKIWMSQPD